MEIPFSDQTVVKQMRFYMLLIKFDAQSVVSFTFKESFDKFLSCCHELYMILNHRFLNNLYSDSFPLYRSKCKLVFSITLIASISKVLDPF